MKKIIILQNNQGRLANQLWLYANVYAFCLEKNYICHNPSFYQYSHYFNTRKSNGVTQFIFSNKLLRKSKLIKGVYLLYSEIIKIINKSKIIKSGNDIFILPPDKQIEKTQKEALLKMDSNKKTFYFCGWFFRTPNGLEKYHEEIRNYFRPKEKYLHKIKELIEPLKTSGKFLVGVHIRQGDYKIWNGGRCYYSFEEVRRILELYLKRQTEPEKTFFVICSDEKINDDVFAGLPYIKGPGSEIEDLYALANTDTIIGSDSSFGAWAAYYGRIPFTTFPEKKTE